jgi:hypothetical protein
MAFVEIINGVCAGEKWLRTVVLIIQAD